MGKTVKIVIAICVLCSLFIFIRTTDFEKVAVSIQMVGGKFGILLFITFIAYTLGTLSWQYCLGEKSGSVSTVRLFLIRHIGETVSLINPTSLIGGEAVKAILLRNSSIDKTTVITSILSSRVIMILTQLLLFTLAFIILAFSEERVEIFQFDSHWLLYFLIAFLALFIGIRYFWSPLKKQVLKTRPGRLLRKKTMAIRLKISEIITELQFLFKRHKNMLLLACIFAVLHWIAGSLEFYFILKILGVKASITQALLVDMGVIFFKAAGAFIPGQIGVEEYGNKIMLMAIGIPGTEIWVTASILRRVRQLIWIAIGIGIYFVLFKKREPALQEI